MTFYIKKIPTGAELDPNFLIELSWIQTTGPELILQAPGFRVILEVSGAFDSLVSFPNNS